MRSILLADDSPHAQRMGEKILREEGYAVTGLRDGTAALKHLREARPDLLIVDVSLPGVDGYELCRLAKASYPYMRVILTAGATEILDDGYAWQVGCDSVVRKPFEASKVVATVGPLIEEVRMARALWEAEQQALQHRAADGIDLGGGPDTAEASSAAASDGEMLRVQMAVAVALEAAMPGFIREITEKVLLALKGSTHESTKGPVNGPSGGPSGGQ
jgi:DNA-binding response OmpR family regulator